MRRKFSLPLLATLILAVELPAADWTTFGGDPQRTLWAKEETDLTKANVAKLKLEWSLKLENEAKELNALTAPVIHSQIITPRGFKEVIIVAGSSDKVFAIDADTGKLMWQKTMSIEGASKQRPGWLCPNSLNATPVIDRRARTVYVASPSTWLTAKTVWRPFNSFQASPSPGASAWSTTLSTRPRRRAATVSSPACTR
jgi:PQQ-like domain